MAQQIGPRGRGNKRSSGPSGGRGNGLRAVDLRAVPCGFLRAVERDFFVEYVEKPTDKTRWSGRLFRWKLCRWEAFENEPGRREVQMNARPRPTQSEFFERSSLLKPRRLLFAWSMTSSRAGNLQSAAWSRSAESVAWSRSASSADYIRWPSPDT
jgi:hypothetical protein